MIRFVSLYKYNITWIELDWLRRWTGSSQRQEDVWVRSRSGCGDVHSLPEKRHGLAQWWPCDLQGSEGRVDKGGCHMPLHRDVCCWISAVGCISLSSHLLHTHTQTQTQTLTFVYLNIRMCDHRSLFLHWQGDSPIVNRAGRTPKHLYILPGGVAEVE